MNVLWGALAATMLAAAAALPAQAQAPAAGPAVVVTYIEVTTSGTTETAALLKSLAGASRKEAGNLRYEVLQEVGRTSRFAILEAWSDGKAFESHGGSAAMRQFRDKLKPLQAAPYDERLCVAMVMGPVQAAGAAGAVYVLTHVDVPNNFKDQAATLLTKLAEDGRKEPGGLRFEAWPQGNRPNHFTVNEVWKDQAAYEAHLLAAGTRDFRAKVGPMLGALYDDRVFRSLE
jgi:quinol monooxygenase YgiN